MGDPSALEASSHYFQVAGVISKYEKNEDIWKIKVYVPAEASIRVPMQCWIGEIKTGISDYLLACQCDTWAHQEMIQTRAI